MLRLDETFKLRLKLKSPASHHQTEIPVSLCLWDRGSPWLVEEVIDMD